MEASKHAFGVEGYKQIRGEVAVLLSRIESLFRYSLVVSATVFAWLLTQAFDVTVDAAICLKLPKAALEIAWAIPPAFILLSGVFVLATHIRIMQMSGFLEASEMALGAPALSWEVYLRKKPPLFFVTSAIAWTLMFGAALYASSVGLSLNDLPVCSRTK